MDGSGSAQDEPGGRDEREPWDDAPGDDREDLGSRGLPGDDGGWADGAVYDVTYDTGPLDVPRKPRSGSTDKPDDGH